MDIVNKIVETKANKVPLTILIVVLVLGIGAVLFASNVNPEDIAPKVDVQNLPVLQKTTPELNDSLGWLNTEPLSSSDLKGKVVVYDFWTYSCINCQRTIPYLRALNDRYEKDGLVLIGIHTPEFDFEKDKDNVQAASEKYGVNWPVLFDDNKVNWRNFENQYWPAKYISDKKGQIRYSHFGEGRYEETEDVIRELLGIPEEESRAAFPGEEDADVSKNITPEIYINPFRGSLNVEEGKSVVAKKVRPKSDQVSLFGDVDVQIERTVLSNQGASLLLNYQAAEVNLVAEPLDNSEVKILKVTLDSKPIPEGLRGKGVEVDSQGDTIIRIVSSDLINVINSKKIGRYILEFEAQTPNIALYAFTFGR